MKLKNTLIACAVAGGMLFAATNSATAGDIDEQYGDWTYRMYEDKFENSRQHVAFVIQGEGRDRGLLAIKCDRDTHAPYVQFSKVQGYFGSRGNSRVRYKVDDGEIINETWEMFEKSVSNLNKDEVNELDHRLISGSSVTIEATDFRHRPHRSTFPLNGSGQALNRILDGCGPK